MALLSCADGVRETTMPKQATDLDRLTAAGLPLVGLPDTNERISDLIRRGARGSEQAALYRSAQLQGMACREGNRSATCIYRNSMSYYSCRRPLDAFSFCPSHGPVTKNEIRVRIEIDRNGKMTTASTQSRSQSAT